MSQFHRNNPDSEECQRMAHENEQAKFASKMEAEQEAELAPTLTDAELVALAALVKVEAVLMAGDNEYQRLLDGPPQWRTGCGYMPAGMLLSDELIKRGLKL